MRLLLLSLAALLPLAACVGRPNHPAGPSARPFSPAGEPLPADSKGAQPYVAALAAWFDRTDADQDGRVTPAEVEADSNRFFALLDRDRDGFVNSQELADSRGAADRMPDQPDSAPDGSRPPRQGRPPGSPAGSAAPDPVMTADRNLDFRVTQQELARMAVERLLMMDANHDGSVDRAEVEAGARAQRAQALRRPPGGQGGPGRGSGRGPMPPPD